MANEIQTIAGIILIGLAFVSFVLILPSLNTATQTGATSSWENSSTSVKATVNLLNSASLLLPVLLFFSGLAVVIKSL